MGDLQSWCGYRGQVSQLQEEDANDPISPYEEH